MVQPINISAGRVAMQTDPASIDTESRVRSAPAVASAGETVALSSEATALPAVLQSGPPIDTGRVNKLRSAIAEGTYRPDPVRIADCLSQNIVEMSN